MAGLVLPRKERKELRRQEAIERNNAYQKQISTPDGIRQYIKSRQPGAKQLSKLKSKLK